MTTLEMLKDADAIFSALPEPELNAFIALGQTLFVQAREMVCRKGDAGEHFYLVLDGKLKVSSQSEDGREVILGILAGGDVFGEMSLIDGGPRSADVTAMSEARILCIHRPDFLGFLQRNPAVATGLLIELCRRLRRTDGQVEDIRFHDLKTRLARVLHTLAVEHGRTTLPAGSVRIDLKLSQEELGGLVDASRESINKQLKAWEVQGLMTSTPAGLVIHDLERLHQHGVK